jgi:hypothetical protein
MATLSHRSLFFVIGLPKESLDKSLANQTVIGEDLTSRSSRIRERISWVSCSRVVGVSFVGCILFNKQSLEEQIDFCFDHVSCSTHFNKACIPKNHYRASLTSLTINRTRMRKRRDGVELDWERRKMLK